MWREVLQLVSATCWQSGGTAEQLYFRGKGEIFLIYFLIEG